jgi:hypothetical protein
VDFEWNEKVCSTPTFLPLGDEGKDFDDDGVAVFWKKDKFDAIKMTLFEHQKIVDGVVSSEASILIVLKHKGSQKLVNVMTTHLPSGAGDENEEKRLNYLLGRPTGESDDKYQFIEVEQGKSPGDVKELKGGLSEFVKAMDKDMTIFALDANSQPGESVWKQFTGDMDMKSVWQPYLDDLSESGDSSRYALVSVNKLRGPLSDQPKKVGYA